MRSYEGRLRSALTFNGHRIHCDLPYAQGVERPLLSTNGPSVVGAPLGAFSDLKRQLKKAARERSLAQQLQ
jgi:hydroxyacyl-ACP dehydratase HTD2-like protein with hotdog domain